MRRVAQYSMLAVIAIARSVYAVLRDTFVRTLVGYFLIAGLAFLLGRFSLNAGGDTALLLNRRLGRPSYVGPQQDTVVFLMPNCYEVCRSCIEDSKLSYEALTGVSDTTKN